MDFVKNYKDWIDETGILTHLQTHEGDTMPVFQPDKWKDHPTLSAALEQCRPWYAHRNHDFQQFNVDSPDMQNFKFKMPVIEGDARPSSWWFIKLLPGQMQPMHLDPHLVYCKNPNRYTMFLIDWKPGHIFTWDNHMNGDYKAGDTFKWKDPMCYHGVCNIGYEVRYTFQITTYDR